MAKKEIPAYVETSPGRYELNPAYVKAKEAEEAKAKVAAAKAKTPKAPKAKK